MATLQGLTPLNLYNTMVPDFRGEALQETQNRLGHAQLQGLNMQNQQAQRQAQQQQQFEQDWQQAYASGDPKALEAIVAKYPGQMETVQKGMGFRDDNHRMQLGNAARDLRLAMASKQPGAVGQAAQTHAGTLASIGSSPEGLLQMLQDDPQGLARTVDLVGMSALGVKDYYDTEHRRNQLAETQRSNRAGESLTARGQDIQIRGQNISAQNAALGRQIKQAEVQDKVLDRQIASETNALRLEELKQKQVDVRQKAEVARADRQAAAQGAVDTFSTALDSLDTITSSPGLSKSVGFNSAFPTVPGTDAANFEAQLDTFKAQTFLPMVQSLKGMGALSDAEGKKLSDAVGALSPKMSEKAFRKSADTIKTTLQKKLQNVKKQYGYQEPAQAQQGSQPQQQAGFSSLWGD